MKRKFIIYTWPFDESAGGRIVCHLLCRRLNDIGEEAMVWEGERKTIVDPWRLRDWLGTLRSELRRLGRHFDTGPFNNPIAGHRDLRGAIVVYPEILEGNLLGADAVVRWLLHRPGHFTGKAIYGPDDLIFFYQEAFNDPAINPDPTNRLTLTWFNDAYRQTNFGERRGSAYLLRKGKGRPIVHDLTDSVCVDDMSHEERAAVFNRVERFYSYDLYCMFGIYAAMCGAVPIFVPEPGVSKREWTPDEQDWNGQAYGEDDVPWAVATRGKLMERIDTVRAEQDDMLRRFVAKCRAAFGDRP